MKNYICINGKKTELTSEQMRQLGIEPEKKNPFKRSEYGKWFYYISGNGIVGLTNDYNSEMDVDCFEAGNYCTDKSLMEQRALHETLNRLLWRYSMENGGGEIDWDYNTKSKYFIYYDIQKRKLDISSFYIWKQDTIFFSTRKIAESAIEEIIKPFMAKHPEFIW